MASAAHLKTLVKAHLSGDDPLFLSVARQIAAHEEKQGHGKIAQTLRTLLDGTNGRQRVIQPMRTNQVQGLKGLVEMSQPDTELKEMILEKALSVQIERIIREQHHADRIREHGLEPRRKILLIGPPGTGKTMTGSVLASTLAIPLIQIRLDGLIGSMLGETATKLRRIFDATSQMQGVYLFDEFDAIGSQRGSDNDVGEIRRVLNSFLQMIEQDRSKSLVVAATNHPALLDDALFRRFDDIVHYKLPDQTTIENLLRARLARHATKPIDWARLAETATGLSHADVTRVANETLKAALITPHDAIEESDIVILLEERRASIDELARHRHPNRGDG